MAKTSILTGVANEPVHSRTTAGTEKSQGVVLVIDGSDAAIDASKGLRVNQAGSGISSQRLTIATAGAAAQFPSAACKAVAVYALPGNTQRVMIGASNVDASDAGFNGIPIPPPSPGGISGVVVQIENANLLYLDVLVNAEGVTWTALT